MSLTPQEVDTLWELRRKLPIDNKRIWQGGIAFLFISSIPIMVNKFAEDTTRSVLIADSAYLIYLFIAVIAASLWAKKRAGVKHEWAILLAIGFDGIAFFFMSINCFLAALLTTSSLPNTNFLASIVWFFYMVLTVFTLSQAEQTLKNQLKSPSKIFLKEVPLALRILWVFSGGSVAGGTFLGMLLSKTSYALVGALGLMVCGSLIVLPFGILLIYEFFILALRRNSNLKET